MMTVGGILFGSTQIMPQLLQTSFPYTAELSGLAIMPGGLAMLLMMPIAGQVTGRLQPNTGLRSVLARSHWRCGYSTTLVPDASFDDLATIRVYQTIGLPFLFIPINTIAYDGLPPDKTAQGSALINVARNLGGSIGVSLANTELLQRSQFHQARLVGNLEPRSPVLQTGRPDHPLFHPARGTAGDRASARVRLHRADGKGTGIAAGLYRRVLHLGDICGGPGADRARPDPPRGGRRPGDRDALRLAPVRARTEAPLG